MKSDHLQNSNPLFKKMISDRMTPEFKLNNEDLIRVGGNYKDSRSNSGNFPIMPFDDNDLSPRMESLLLGI